MSYKLFWGDLHSHCSISYGYGTAAQALLRAQKQLDFCSITGHAFWPDMPTGRDQYGEIIDYHNVGFARLARNWQQLLDEQKNATTPGSFIALPSYEWHSLKYGDHNVYAPGAQLDLKNADALPELRDTLTPFDGIAIPHHIGYAAGYRGIDWAHFSAERSPFVEIFSLHGCSLSTSAPYPMLHDMGPRDAGSTAEEGWRRGLRFGIAGGTDHHAAYPGSFGDGRMGVFAKELTRESLWEAFKARRVFAATGDRIDARMTLNGAWPGEVVHAPAERRTQINVQAPDSVQLVELVKNGKAVHRFFPLDAGHYPPPPYRLRITWGWGKRADEVHWDSAISLSEGEFTSVDSCFRGAAIVAPQTGAGDKQTPDEHDLPHEITSSEPQRIAWRSITHGNLSMRHATTQALTCEVDAPLQATLTVEANGNRYQHTLQSLLRAARTHFLRGWLTGALQLGPLIPAIECSVSGEYIDHAETDSDVYRLQVVQHNGQCAWLTPVWATR